MMLRHPNDQVLQRWLNGEGDNDLDEHVTTCQRCATNLERLDHPPRMRSARRWQSSSRRRST